MLSISVFINSIKEKNITNEDLRINRLKFTRHFTVKTQYKIVKMDSIYFPALQIRRKYNFHLGKKKKKQSSQSAMVVANKTIISKK